VTAGFGPRSPYRAARSPACRSVKSSGSSEKSSKGSVIVHSLATSCGQHWCPGRRGSGCVEGGYQLGDGRHLGRSRSRSSSRKNGGRGPGPRRRPRERRFRVGGAAQAARRGSTRSYPSRGWGSCGEIVTRCPSLTGAALAASDSPTGAAAISRREVSERIGSG
jgi:hypothetical protein